MPPDDSAPDTLPVELELPPSMEQPLGALEMAIFNTYASTPARANAFDLILDLRATLHRGTTRASLVKPKPSLAVEYSATAREGSARSTI